MDASKFSPENVTEPTKKAAEFLEIVTANGPKWWEVGAEKYREMWARRRCPSPSISQKPSMELFLRVMLAARSPSASTNPIMASPAKASSCTFMEVDSCWQRINSEARLFSSISLVILILDSSDSSLREYANKCQLTTISVGYRLAPEHPYPAGLHDSIDVAEYMADHAREVYGSPLRFISGESAGGCLAALSALQLMRSRPSFQLSGLVFSYGFFDLSLGLPTVVASTKPLLINLEILEPFMDAYLPGMSAAEHKQPSVSPLYADLQALAKDSTFPPALFLCGIADPLLDETVLMSTKWSIAGGEAVVKIYLGATHAFTVFPGLPVAEEANAVIMEFVQKRLSPS